jgi:septum formation protein
VGQPLVLASASPQRTAILDELGIAHEVIPAHVDELAHGEPVEVAVENARRKARAVAARPGCANRVVLAADTVVALGGEILPKPPDEAAARVWLARLSGREHVVAGGLCVIAQGEERTASAVSRVRFRTVGEAEIEAYVASGEWQGRAGGYAIQGRGRDLVEALDCDELNVVGLSPTALREVLPGVVPPAA